MKKVVRTVWIGALTGLAFLSACCTPQGLTRKERKQLMKERDSIQAALDEHERSLLYGPPEMLASYSSEGYYLQYQLDSINQRLGNDVDLKKSRANYKLSLRHAELMQQYVNLREALRRREDACIYGSPEVMQQYGEETRRMRQDLENLQKEIENTKLQIE